MHMYVECHDCTEKFTPLTVPDLMVSGAIVAWSDSSHRVIRTNVITVSIAMVNLTSSGSDVQLTACFAPLCLKLRRETLYGAPAIVSQRSRIGQLRAFSLVLLTEVVALDNELVD